MLALRSWACHALLAFGAIMAGAPVRAGTMYSVYQGGVGGTLEVQFTTQVPISPAVIPAGPTPTYPANSFQDSILQGTVQYVNSGGGGLGFESVVTIPKSDTINFATDSILRLVFASGVIPTTPGTYALVPGATVNNNSSLVGSFGLSGNEYEGPSFVTMFDTVVLSDVLGSGAVSEPPGLLLALTAILLTAWPLYCWTRIP